MAGVLDLPLGFDPPSSLPPCEQEAVRSRGSGRVWGLQRPGADRVEASWLAFSPQGPEGLVGGIQAGSNWLGPLGLCRRLGPGVCIRGPEQRQDSSAQSQGFYLLS